MTDTSGQSLLSNACPQADAIREQTEEYARWREAIFGEGGAWPQDIKPALHFVAGVGERLDKLCTWFKGKWPWVAAGGYLLLNRTINVAPDEAPKLISALTDLVKAMTP